MDAEEKRVEALAKTLEFRAKVAEMNKIWFSGYDARDEEIAMLKAKIKELEEKLQDTIDNSI